MYLSDNSSYYETSYSVDVKIERLLQEQKKEEQDAENIIQSQRKEEFEEYFKTKQDEIFELPGLTFLKFTHAKVKFSLEPSKVVDFISKKIIFYCTLIYSRSRKKWKLKKDTIPVGPITNYKLKVFNIFHKRQIEDDHLPDAIQLIYNYLKEWSEYEEEFKLTRYEAGEGLGPVQIKKYKRGQLDDLELDSEDEELFLSDEEREALFLKRQRILRRMVPPQSPRIERRTRRRRRRPIIESSSGSNG